MVLPHDWLSALARTPRVFEECFKGSDASVREYWQNEARFPLDRRHPWLKPEGAASQGVDVNLGVPWGIHGDDAGVFLKEKVAVVHMHGILPPG